MSIFDSHCHPQLSQYDNDREEMLKRAKDADVFMICVGTDYETSKSGIELSQKHEGIWASVGLHPNDLNYELRITNYELLLKEDRVVAIGEVGLDYYRTPEPEKQKKQRDVFGQFIDLAIKSDKPLILHSRDSGRGSTGRVHSDMIEILNSKFKNQNSNLRGVAHSFTGSINDVKKYLDLGFYLGFNGILTFPSSRRPPSSKTSDGHSKATKDVVPGMYDEVVKYTPLDRILLETDAPFLSPEPYRGKRNEPAHVVGVAKKIAELKNEPLEKIIEQTTKNCQELFKLV